MWARMIYWTCRIASGILHSVGKLLFGGLTGLGGSQEGRSVMALASVHDVAAYILRNCGEMTAMKLQKLVYYCQAWSLVWDERPLFRAPIQAWANGPVIPALYREHRGQFKVAKWPRGDAQRLGKDARETVDAVLRYYGSRTAQWLSDLAHAEAPWRDARVGIPEGDRGSAEITHAALHEYYSGLLDRG